MLIVTAESRGRDHRGGPATRLGGVAKPFLNVGGRTIAERQLALLRAAGFARVFVVANDPAPWAALAVEVVPDRVAGRGRWAASTRR